MSLENNTVAGVSLLTNTASTRLKPQVIEDIYLMGQDQEMFYTFLNMMPGGDRSAKRLFITRQKQNPYRIRCKATDTTAAGAINAAATLVLDLYTHLIAGDIVQNQTTGDQFRVETTPTSTSVSTYRWGDLSINAVAANEEFVVIGYAAKENQNLADARSRNTDQFDVYLQEFEETISISKWLQMSQMYGPAEMERQIKIQALEFKRRKNRTLLYGYPENSSINSSQTYGTAGAFYYGDRYNPYFVHSGTLTPDDIGTHLGRMKRFTGAGEFALVMGHELFVKMGLSLGKSGEVRYDQKENKISRNLNMIDIQGMSVSLVADYQVDEVSPDKVLICHKPSVGINRMSAEEQVRRGQEILGARRDTLTLIEICGLDTVIPEAFGSFQNVARFKVS